VLGTTLLVALVLVVGASAGSPAFHIIVSPVGDVFGCEGDTYTVVSGTLAITQREGSSASGNESFTATIVPRNVTLEDSNGDLYRAVGATWFGGTFNAQQGTGQATFIFKLQIMPVDGGRPADAVNLVGHASVNGSNFEFNHGTCDTVPE
jgi:hypothetical protein